MSLYYINQAVFIFQFSLFDNQIQQTFLKLCLIIFQSNSKIHIYFISYYFIASYSTSYYITVQHSTMQNYEQKNKTRIENIRTDPSHTQTMTMDPYIFIKHQKQFFQNRDSFYYYNIVKKSTRTSPVLKDAFIYIDIDKAQLIQTTDCLPPNQQGLTYLLKLEIKQKIDLNEKFTIRTIQNIKNSLQFKKEKIYVDGENNHIIKPQLLMVLQFYNEKIMKQWLDIFQNILKDQKEKFCNTLNNLEQTVRKSENLSNQKVFPTNNLLIQNYQQEEQYNQQRIDLNNLSLSNVSFNRSRKSIFPQKKETNLKQIYRQTKSYDKFQKTPKQFNKQIDTRSQTQQKYQKRNPKNLQLVTQSEGEAYQIPLKKFFQQEKTIRNCFTPKYQNNSYNRQMKIQKDLEFRIPYVKMQKKQRYVCKKCKTQVFQIKQFIKQLKVKMRFHNQRDELSEYIKRNCQYLQKHSIDQDLIKQQLQSKLIERQHKIEQLNGQIRQYQRKQCQKNNNLIQQMFQQGKFMLINSKRYYQRDIRKLQQNLQGLFKQYEYLRKTHQFQKFQHKKKQEELKKIIENQQKNYINYNNRLQQSRKQIDRLCKLLQAQKMSIKLYQDQIKGFQTNLSQSRQKIIQLQKDLSDQVSSKKEISKALQQQIQSLQKQNQKLLNRLNQMQVFQNQQTVLKNRQKQSNYYQFIKCERIGPTYNKKYNFQQVQKQARSNQKFNQQSLKNNQNQVKYPQISVNVKDELYSQKFKNRNEHLKEIQKTSTEQLNYSKVSSTISQTIQSSIYEIDSMFMSKNIGKK